MTHDERHGMPATNLSASASEWGSHPECVDTRSYRSGDATAKLTLLGVAFARGSTPVLGDARLSTKCVNANTLEAEVTGVESRTAGPRVPLSVTGGESVEFLALGRAGDQAEFSEWMRSDSSAIDNLWRRLSGEFMAIARDAGTWAWHVLVPLLTVILFAAAIAQAQEQCELAGTVLNKDGHPRANVPVDILGPASVYTEANGSGKFTVRIRAGTYIVRVRDGARRMEFEQHVGPCSGATQRVEATYQLNW